MRPEGRQLEKDDLIVLVMPSYRHCVRSLFVFHENRSIGSKPPLGLISLAGYLKKSGFTRVEIFDASLDHLTPEETAKALAAKGAAVIGFSVMTDVWFQAFRTMELLKESSPAVLLCVGGAHASIYPELSLRASAADLVVAGDGELAFAAALGALAAGKEPLGIEGVYWKDESGAVRPPPQPLAVLKDLDVLPVPDLGFIRPERYDTLLCRKRSTTMITSRGCPCGCVFCKLNVQTVLSRSPGLVADEFEARARQGFELIEVYDDTFTWDRERVLEICRELVRRKVSIEWSVRSRVNKVDRELLAEMKRAGCQRIHYGIESGNDLVLRGARKGITVEQARNAVRLAKEAGFEVLNYFMVGFLDETPAQAADTLALALELDSDYVAFAVLIPYPGAAIYQQALERGVIATDYWRAFCERPTPDFVIPSLIEDRMTRDDLARFVDRAHFRFYWRPRRLLRELLAVRSLPDLGRRLEMGNRLLARFCCGGRG